MAFNDEVMKAICAHGQWKHHLNTAIATGKSQFNVADSSKDNLCAFGKWLYGPTIPVGAKNAEFDEVCTLHARFHELASRVLDLALKGNKDAARALMDAEFTDVSGKLSQALMGWKRTAAQTAA